MKTVFLYSCVLTLILITAFRPAPPALPIGADLPKGTIKLKDISGKEITLQEQFKANGLLVMFSCNTCPVVKGYQQRTNAICKYAAQQDLGVVLLNSNEAYRADDESLEAMRNYAGNQQYQWFYVVDKNNELADAFGASRTPECFVFNSKGKLVYKGAIDDNPGDAGGVRKEYLKTAIDDMIAGKDIAVKETRSVGCSIKRVN